MIIINFFDAVETNYITAEEVIEFLKKENWENVPRKKNVIYFRKDNNHVMFTINRSYIDYSSSLINSLIFIKEVSNIQEEELVNLIATGSRRPSWDLYFLEIAKSVSKRSTCLRRKYGAVIVKDNTIISTGYNGSPKGEKNCCDINKCKREELNIPKGERYELCLSLHGEQNAIINGNPLKMKDASIYIYGSESDGTIADSSPCLICERFIKNAGITDIIYFDKNKKKIIHRK